MSFGSGSGLKKLGKIDWSGEKKVCQGSLTLRNHGCDAAHWSLAMLKCAAPFEWLLTIDFRYSNSHIIDLAVVDR